MNTVEWAEEACALDNPCGSMGVMAPQLLPQHMLTGMGGNRPKWGPRSIPSIATLMTEAAALISTWGTSKSISS